ncbi:hypothetical protein ACI2LC_38800 [Nonomuraea wenchangensis]|uniref:hypothetical protein n=1 Tax=Nonomuraea wenchangensis TaxID=568860 RepID=UPI0037952285
MPLILPLLTKPDGCRFFQRLERSNRGGVTPLERDRRGRTLPASGKPHEIHVDNATEFRREARRGWARAVLTVTELNRWSALAVAAYHGQVHRVSGLLIRRIAVGYVEAARSVAATAAAWSGSAMT